MSHVTPGTRLGATERHLRSPRLEICLAADAEGHPSFAKSTGGESMDGASARDDPRTLDELVRSACEGSADAWSALYHHAYPQMLRYATRLMGAQRVEHTFSAQDLLHEGYLKLKRAAKLGLTSYAHFLATSFRAMRQILIDHAESKNCQKRGGAWKRSRLTGILLHFETRVIDLLPLHEALESLRAIDPDALVIVELRFYEGWKMKEIARYLHRGLRSVEHDWEFARTFLHGELST